MEYPIVRREQPIVVSERVGDVIDAEERMQFGLFPTVEDFREARFYRFREGGYALEITTTDEKFVSVNSWSSAVLLMRDYIDNYERFKSYPDSFAIKWKIRSYDDLGVPITKYEADPLANIGRAVSCGCTGGLVAGLAAAAFGLAAFYSFDPSGADTYSGIGIMMLAIVLPAIVAPIAGVVTGLGVYLSDKSRAVQTIKEMRKPRVVEMNVEGN